MKILAPAKVNLTLEILGKRPDGFHELRTIMLPLSLCDELELERIESGIELLAPGCDCAVEDNLAYRAARLFFEDQNIAGGIKISLKKNVPSGAGLGGGSSDAASVLLALNRIFEAGLDDDHLMQMAARLGSDCAFFVKSSALEMGGRGEKLLRAVDVEDRSYLLVLPPFGLSTPKVYKELKKPLTKGSDSFNISISNDDFIAPEGCLLNDLEEAAFVICPELSEVKQDLIDAGALGAMMSGSGSTVFGIFFGEDHLSSALGRLRRREGYQYTPVTRFMGERYGHYRG